MKTLIIGAAGIAIVIVALFLFLPLWAAILAVFGIVVLVGLIALVVGAAISMVAAEIYSD